MGHAIDRAWGIAQAPGENAPAAWLAVRAHFAAELAQAACVIEGDPDVAAVALDGLLWRMLDAWYAAQDEDAPARGALLADLGRRAPMLAWRVRLALRAPDVAARLAHCRQLLAALGGEEHADGAPLGRLIALERHVHP